MNEPVRAIGWNLRRARSGRRLSLQELAGRSGVAKATLANLEAGRGNPTIDTLWALALALGVPVVASDTDFRPEGVVLFRRGEVDDLVNTLTRTLQRPHGLPHGGGADGDAFDRLLAIYDRLAPVGREAV